jgi:hypothetical protein
MVRTKSFSPPLTYLIVGGAKNLEAAAEYVSRSGCVFIAFTEKTAAGIFFKIFF